jgi:hypothetical protein
MVNTKKIEITLYYANWCGHCVTFKPEWNEIKKNISNLSGGNKNIKIKTMEYEHEELENNDGGKKNDGGKINDKKIEGYPTIKIKLSCGGNKKEYNFDDYGKERSAKYITDFISNLCYVFDKY